MHKHTFIPAAILLTLTACDDPDAFVGVGDEVEVEAIEADEADDTTTGGLDLAVPVEPTAVIGGQTASVTDFPFIVALTRTSDGGFVCGGTLISRNHVLTAASCLGSQPFELKATIGHASWVYANANPNNTQWEIHTLGKQVTHPLYAAGGDPAYDLAVLVLEKPSQFKPVELAEPNGPSDRASWLAGAQATLLGWGGWELGVTGASGNLRKLSVPVISDATASATIPAFDGIMDIALGGQPGNKGACTYDRGGPALVATPTGWQQIGVLSAQLDSCTTAGKPNLAARIATYGTHRWIRGLIHESPLVADVTGDDQADIVSVTANGDVFVAISDGTTFGPKNKWRTGYDTTPKSHALGDFNGDDHADLWTFHDNMVVVNTSTGSNFSGSAYVSSPYPGNRETLGLVGNVNGDTRDDAVLVSREYVFGEYSTTRIYVITAGLYGFMSRQEWPVADLVADATLMLADVNNDGKSDLVEFTQGMAGSEARVALSTGTGFAAKQTWNGWFAPVGEVPAVGRFGGTDDVADILTFVRNGEVYAGYSNSVSSFGSVKLSGSFGGPTDTLRVGDVNGDGIDELIAFSQDANADVTVARTGYSLIGTKYLAHGDFAP